MRYDHATYEHSHAYTYVAQQRRRFVRRIRKAKDKTNRNRQNAQDTETGIHKSLARVCLLGAKRRGKRAQKLIALVKSIGSRTGSKPRFTQVSANSFPGERCLVYVLAVILPTYAGHAAYAVMFTPPLAAKQMNRRSPV